VSHANARTNVFARRLIVECVAAGWPAAHVAEQLGITRATVYKWLRRNAEGGDAALADRSSRPIRIPHRTSDRVEQKVLAARRRRKRGAVVLAAELALNPSTVGRILARHQVPHLSAIDPITGEAVRSSRRSPNRYEHPAPGAMVHVDVKKLGRTPSGACRPRDRAQRPLQRRPGVHLSAACPGRSPGRRRARRPRHPGNRSTRCRRPQRRPHHDGTGHHRLGSLPHRRCHQFSPARRRRRPWWRGVWLGGRADDRRRTSAGVVALAVRTVRPGGGHPGELHPR
jgi:transposase